jgi:UDP-3-O-[3-hydroxymyristoyl] glucosamine N-acyltransferase
MVLTTAQIAELVGGTLEGDGALQIVDVAGLDHGRPGTLSFLYDARYTPYVYTTESTAVIVSRDFLPERPVQTALIRVESPYRAFNKVMTLRASLNREAPGIDLSAIIHPSAQIGEEVYIGPFVSIGANCVIEADVQIHAGCSIGKGCRIGAGTTLYPQVVLYPQTEIGQRCILHAHCVVGSDGFGFLKNESGDNEKIPQLGHVIIEDDVEIGAGTCIDCSTLGVSRIGRNVKIDNLVHIAHNVTIGERTLIAAQAGISGGVVLGRDCVVGGQVGFVGHLKIADGSRFGGQSGVNRSIETPNMDWRGSPAQELGRQQRLEVLLRRLPDLVRRVDELEAQLAARSNGHFDPD